MWNYKNSQNFISFEPKHIFRKIENNFEDIEEENEEICFFLKLFDKELLDKIIEESNKYFRKKYNIDNNKKLVKNSYFDLYMKNGGINEKNLFEFISILLIMGIVRMPRLVNYWSNDPILNTYIPKIRSKNFFKMIGSALHLSINEDNPLDDENDLPNNKIQEVDIERNNNLNYPREKINAYLKRIIQNSQKYFILGKEITIDESMIKFEGRNNMIFYIPSKPIKWGFKLHCLVDSNSNYLYNVIFDPGRDNKNLIIENVEDSFTENIALSLVKNIENSGRTLFFDSWYSSISLIHKLTKRVLEQ